jgi:hypothetical protein
VAISYSDLKLALMVTGTETGNWGDITNDNLTAIQQAISETASVSFSSADVTLALTNTNTSQTARNLRLVCTGTSGGARNLNVPAVEKLYLVANGLADTVTVKTVAGTGVAVPTGKSMLLYCDAINVLNVVDHLASLTLATPLPVASGGTGSNNATTARTNLGLVIGTDVPSPTGSGASGVWNIGITGTAANATLAANATQAANATAVNGATSNGFGTRTVSTAAPTGGVDGDIWYQY